MIRELFSKFFYKTLKPFIGDDRSSKFVLCFVWGKKVIWENEAFVVFDDKLRLLKWDFQKVCDLKGKDWIAECERLKPPDKFGGSWKGLLREYTE